MLTTAGTAEKCRICEELGAEKAFNYREEDWFSGAKELTGGADVILDMVGGPYIAKDINLLRPDGRLVFIAFLGGSKVEIDFLKVMVKRLTITGSTLRPRDIGFKAAIAANLEARVWPLISAGRIRPLVHKTFPLDQAAAAHALMESSTHVGKIVLTA